MFDPAISILRARAVWYTNKLGFTGVARGGLGVIARSPIQGYIFVKDNEIGVHVLQ